ncbi:hypothetical protein EDB89DRAFT_2007376 [Lactarius sanguifluus]|nr:hypothetical protein EDB89DRAFT_2007376 [Lactarius sanguifluus]
MFHTRLHNLLRKFTAHPNGSLWDVAWTSILTFLLPDSEGYYLAPHRRQNQMSDLVIEVVKISDDPFQMRTILIVQIKNNQHLQSGIETLERQINRHADAAFRGTELGTAISKVYWITTIGPRWRFGVKEDGQELRPLIALHETTHDQASFDDFQILTSLVRDLVKDADVKGMVFFVVDGDDD